MGLLMEESLIETFIEGQEYGIESLYIMVKFIF